MQAQSANRNARAAGTRSRSTPCAALGRSAAWSPRSPASVVPATAAGRRASSSARRRLPARGGRGACSSARRSERPAGAIRRRAIRPRAPATKPRAAPSAERRIPAAVDDGRRAPRPAARDARRLGSRAPARARRSSSPCRAASSSGAASSGEWEPARGRDVLRSGDYVKTSGQRLGRDRLPRRHALHRAPEHAVPRHPRRAPRSAAPPSRRSAWSTAGSNLNTAQRGEPGHDAARRGAGARATPRPRSSYDQATATGALRGLPRRARGDLGRRRDAQGRRARAGACRRATCSPSRSALPPAPRLARARPTTTRLTLDARARARCSPGSRSPAPRATRSRSRATACSSTT